MACHVLGAQREEPVVTSKRDRQARAQAMNAQAHARSVARQQRVERALRQEAELRRALAAPRGPALLIEAEKAKHPHDARQAARVKRFEQLCAAIAERAPRLLEAEHVHAAYQLAAVPWLRELTHWQPQGKARSALFRSLCEHLLAQYRVPLVVWSAFDEPDSELLAPIAAELARGGSLHKLVQRGALPVVLTKHQCHEVLQARADSTLLIAIRRVQVRAEGGGERLLGAWLDTGPGGRIGTRDDEAFWLTVLHIFARAPMFDPAHVGPLVDYIAQRRRTERDYSMKGRSVAALLRGMHAWHRELHQVRAIERTSLQEQFKRSGFRTGCYDCSTRDRRTGHRLRMVYRIDEILTPAELQAEGKAQRHCVYSYAASVAAGGTSIWSLTLDQHGQPERVLTIEVRNRERAIVQVRGWSNRLATDGEQRVLRTWANENGLRYVER